jgi:peroxiredoxin Q/BCP
MIKKGDYISRDIYFPSIRSKYLLVYFYPKNGTPGCTKEACNFRDSYVEFAALGAEIIGVSMDGSTSHSQFTASYKLPFPLLSDPNGKLIDLFEVWRDRHSKTIIRSTFLLNLQGEILKVWRDVDPQVHNYEVLTYIKTIS